MSCKDNGRLLDAYVDGELDVSSTLALEDHLRSCAPCRAAVARLEALRSALRRHAALDPAPESLRKRLNDSLTPRPRGLTWRWGFAFALPGIAALALGLWLALAGPAPQAPTTRVVYHVSSSGNPAAALRNVANHLNAAPGVKIVVVAHNDGVDFLLRGARDENGDMLEPMVRSFVDRGVDFRICNNTLERRRIEARAVIPAAKLVPSGMAEIGRLQSEEGYAYMRL